MSRVLGLLGVSLMLLPAPNAANEGVSCRLSPNALSSRTEEVRNLLAGSQEARELDDGYEFSFPGNRDWVPKLLALIESERQCCPFFKFELTFEPEQGPIKLRLRGSLEVKTFLEQLISESGDS